MKPSNVVFRTLASIAFLTAAAPPAAAACDPDGLQSTGAVYRICMPSGAWNGDLVIWAHGYVAFNEPVAIPEDQLQLPDGTSIPGIVNALGYGFATTSYATNGLAAREGVDDVVDLVNVFANAKGTPGHVYIVGASEGGLVTALAVERHPGVFSGGLATCGPIGNFQGQVGYYGDFRVVIDAFFPGLLPGDATYVPPPFIENWNPYYETVVKPTLFAPENLLKTLQVVSVAKLPYDANNFWPTVERSLRDALWYSVFATNDATQKLNGNPFGNATRVYKGSYDDALLNASVQRVVADPAAVAEMYASYEATGNLARPLVTLHTLYDQQVPWSHELVYYLKTLIAGKSSQLLAIPVNRYGHCNFTPAEVVVSFVLLVAKAQGLFLVNAEAALPSAASRVEYRALAQKNGVVAK